MSIANNKINQVVSYISNDKPTAAQIGETWYKPMDNVLFWFGFDNQWHAITSAVEVPTWSIENIEKDLWLDASDESTIIDVDNKVTTWIDKSGKGRNATQATDIIRPTIGTGEIIFNGYQYLSITNSKSLFKYLHGNSGGCILAVAKFGNIDNPNKQYGLIGNQEYFGPGFSLFYNDKHTKGAIDALGFTVNGADGVEYSAGTYDATTYSDMYNNLILPNQYSMMSVIFNNGSSNISKRIVFSINGAEDNWVNQKDGPTDTNDSIYDLDIGAVGNGNMMLVGSIKEIIILPFIPDKETRAQIIGYFAKKYNLRSYLPDTHPYKSIDVPSNIDPYSEYVNVLLKMEKTNFSTNITDMRNHVITSTANITTDINKDDNICSSLTLNGSNYATVTDIEPIYLNDFTLEFSFNITSLGTGYIEIVTIPNIYPSAKKLIVRSYNKTLHYGPLPVDSGYILTESQWYYIAICRSNGKLKCFINGIKVHEYDSIYNFDGSSLLLGIGWEYNFNMIGAIDDVKYTIGIDRYTENFVVPKTPDVLLKSFSYESLPPTYNDIQLLISETNVFEKNGIVLTKNGNVINTTLNSQPALYFDGNGDYITFDSAAKSLFNFLHDGSPWTIDFWMKPSRVVNSYLFDTTKGTTSYSGILISLVSDKLALMITNGSGSPSTVVLNSSFTTYTFVANNEYHIEISFDYSLPSAHAKLFVNGAHVSSINKLSYTPSSADCYQVLLGLFDPSYPNYAYEGYLSAFRIRHGITHTTNFTPEPYPYL